MTPKISAKFDRGQPIRGRQMQVGWAKIGDFLQITGYSFIHSTPTCDRHGAIAYTAYAQRRAVKR